jgi:uncharacterized repeat protein (TIGR01451 family)
MVRKLLCRLMLAIIVLGAGAIPRPAGAAPTGTTYTVNSTLDEVDANPADGICFSTPSGVCTLRVAIMDANVAIGLNTVILPAGIYTLTLPGLDDTAQAGDLDIGSPLILQGAGSGATVVDGNGAVTGDRVFHILSSARTVSLRGVTIRNGVALFGGGGVYVEDFYAFVLNDVIVEDNMAEEGGGVWANLSDATLTMLLSHVIVRGNTATTYGGSLELKATSANSSVVIAQSEICSNTAAEGGGILNASVLLVVDSRLHDNQAAYYGGAIYDEGEVSLKQTTLEANTAGRRGGGLFNSNAAETLVNSTLSRNIASEYGGGLYAAGGQLQLLNVTVAGNRVQYSNATQTDLGGGVFLTHTVNFNARNSIVANNLRLNPPRVAPQLDDCSSHDSVGGMHYNLFTTLAHCTYLLGGGQSNNLEGQDPLLGPLQNNGGSTPTQALLPGSPAIDAGDPAGCSDGQSSLTTDQRGAPRSDARCDMGAYEVVPEADLAIGQQDSPDPASAGARLTYAPVVTNTGPDTASGLVLTDTFSVSATFGSATPSQGSCLGTATVVCSLGNAANGAHITVTLAVTPSVSGVVTNTATLAGNEFDPVSANNSASETTAVVWRLDLPLVRR